MSQSDDDKILADRVRATARAFNAAVEEACDAGLEVVIERVENHEVGHRYSRPVFYGHIMREVK